MLDDGQMRRVGRLKVIVIYDLRNGSEKSSLGPRWFHDRCSFDVDTSTGTHCPRSPVTWSLARATVIGMKGNVSWSFVIFLWSTRIMSRPPFCPRQMASESSSHHEAAEAKRFGATSRLRSLDELGK
jgi:hypothetical protein